MTPALQGRRQHIRDFIDTLMEAHFNPTSDRPTLGGLADCLNDEETTGSSRDEKLVVDPESWRAYPTGNLRRGHGGIDIWAHLTDTQCYLHIPDGLEVRYKIEVSGDFAALVLQAMPEPPGLHLSENFTEFPIDRLILAPAMIVIYTTNHRHEDVEITFP